jgi:hypothetical protein
VPSRDGERKELLRLRDNGDLEQLLLASDDPS